MNQETCPICGEGVGEPRTEVYRHLYFGHTDHTPSRYHVCVGNNGCGTEYATDEDLRLNRQAHKAFRKPIDEEMEFLYEKMLFNLTEDLLLLMEHRGMTKSQLARHLGLQTKHIEDVFSGKEVLNLKFLSTIVYTLKSDLTITVADRGITHLQEGDKQ